MFMATESQTRIEIDSRVVEHRCLATLRAISVARQNMRHDYFEECLRKANRVRSRYAFLGVKQLTIEQIAKRCEHDMEIQYIGFTHGRQERIVNELLVGARAGGKMLVSRKDLALISGGSE